MRFLCPHASCTRMDVCPSPFYASSALILHWSRSTSVCQCLSVSRPHSRRRAWFVPEFARIWVGCTRIGPPTRSRLNSRAGYDMEPDELLRYVIEALEGMDVPYALAGSIASIAYGEPRSTLDIGLVADLQHQDIARLKGRFPAPEFYLSEEAAAEAVEHRRQFNIIHPASGFKVDVFVAGDAVEASQIARRRRLPAVGVLTATFSPPEELIIKKLEYYRAGGSDKHLRDIRSMLGISRTEIDEGRVRSLAAEHGLADIWSALLARLEES